MSASVTALPLEELFSIGKRVHPDVSCDRSAFDRFIESRLARGTAAEDVRARAAELYLVCACMAGGTGANARLDERFLTEIGGAVARIDADPVFVARVQAFVRHALLVGDGAPRLDDFTGEAPLAAWIRVFAIRAALEHGASSSIGSQAVIDHDPVLRDLHAMHGAAIAEPLRAALAALDLRHRTALRMHVCDRAGIEDIARLFRVHRVTVMGWLDRAARDVRASVIAQLSATHAPPSRSSASQLLRIALASTVVAR